MPYSIYCASCRTILNVPNYAFERISKCPNCGKPVTVDAASKQPTRVEPISPFREPTPPDDIPEVQLAPPDDIPVVEPVYEEDTKSCPFCGETVLAIAKKCKHCGETLNVYLPAAEKKRAAAASGSKANRDPLVTFLSCGCLTILGVMVLSICIGLSSFDREGTNVTAEMIEKSHQRGAEAGREDGRRAGEAEGFAASFNRAEKETYRETIEELYQSHQFQRISLYTVGVMISFFIIGFILQWIVLYLPRRAGYLRDIDWIVLPKEMNQVDLADLSVSLPTESKRLRPPSAGTTAMILLTLMPMLGCASREQDAWQQGYAGNRTAAYQEGWREGATRGEKEGQERGKAEAEQAAQTGRAWQLYTTPAFLALMFGIVVGLTVQYTVLACCNDAHRVPELVTVAFVPAMKHSLAYSILDSRRKLLIWWEQEMRRLAAANELKAAHIKAVHDAIVRKLKVVTTLEELTQARLLDLAQQELSKVVSDAEQKARTPAPRTVACPYCGKTIGYPRKKAGKTVNCPYANCGRPIYLPSNVAGN